MNQVNYGVYRQVMSVAGCTVAYVRSTLTAWGIPADHVAYVGKSRVPDHYTIKPGEAITFHRDFSQALSPTAWLRVNLRSLVVVRAE